MYSKEQLQLIESMWADFRPIAEIAKKLGKTPTAIKEKLKYMYLPERDHHLIRLLNLYGRDLLKYGTNRKDIRLNLQFEREKLKIQKMKGRLDRQHIALEYLRYELDKGHDKNTAIRRAYRRDATLSKIGKLLKMPTKEVEAIVRGDARHLSAAAKLDQKRARSHHCSSYRIVRR
jgi:hypothetical protein